MYELYQCILPAHTVSFTTVFSEQEVNMSYIEFSFFVCIVYDTVWHLFFMGYNTIRVQNLSVLTQQRNWWYLHTPPWITATHHKSKGVPAWESERRRDKDEEGENSDRFVRGARHSRRKSPLSFNCEVNHVWGAILKWHGSTQRVE